MSQEDIIRAWKNPEYRDSLTEEQRSQLPENPAGLIELTETELENVHGGSRQTKDSTICDIVAKTKDSTPSCKPNTSVINCAGSRATGMFSI